MVVALTHRLLGLHPDDVLADYLCTNRVWEFDRHGAAVASGIAAVVGRTPVEAAVRAVMDVEAGYLAASSMQSRPNAVRSMPISRRPSA